MPPFGPDAAGRPVAVLDVEASGLGPGSFPIEVAVAFVADGRVRSWLIRPTAAWAARGEWDGEAQAVHGIARDELLEEGAPVEQVCSELAAEVAGPAVLSDAPGLDGPWLARLYAAVGEQPPFRLEPFWEAANRAGDVGWPGQTGVMANPAVDRAMDLARRRFPREHRAGDDARRLVEALRILEEAA